MTSVATMVTSCFKQKSTLVKCLIVLLAALILILIALFINLVIRRENYSCNAESCIKASAEIIRFVDQSVKPCDDFHAFSCGNYAKNFREVPLGNSSDELNALISEFVKSNDSKPFIMQKLFYQSCLNLLNIEMDQEETLLELFYRLGDWPILRGIKWNGTHFDWVDFAVQSRRLGFNFNWFLDFSIYQDNITQFNFLKIDVPAGLKPLTKKNQVLRKELLTQISVFMGAPKHIAHYETAKTINFEDELGAIAERHRERVRDWDHVAPTRLAIDELQILWPSINWLGFINNITGNRLSGTDYVIFDILDYIKDLNQLIFGTPKRIVVDYMMWKIIEEYWPYLTKPIRDQFEKYNEEYFNKTPEFNRHKFCLNESMKQFPLVVESVYIRRHVTEQKRQLVREMLFIIQRQFSKRFDNAFWMNRESRRRALNLIHNLKFVIGGPEEIFDQFRFADNIGLYGFAFKSMNVIEMLTERRHRHFDYYFNQINRRVINNTLQYYEKVVNVSGFSLINQNTIVVPAALIRDAVFNPRVPNYVNYGTLGKELAFKIFEHIYKGNNTEGIIIDNDHNSYNNNWWVAEAFDDSIRCLAKESPYLPNSEFKRPKKLKDNLATFVAVDVAFEAYREWSLMLQQEYMLPGLKFTPNQLFWIEASKLMCSQVYTSADRDLVRFSILGPLRNSYHFAREFSCPEGTKMNPRKKCRVL